MSHYRSENLRFPQAEYCLPGNPPYRPWSGDTVDLPPHVIPSDIPTPLLDAYVDQFATQPEPTLAQFLETNPNFANPRDLGRVLFHTASLSPFAISVILFNSSYSSRALVFSFMSAIDLDCVSIVDGMRYITQKVAVPGRVAGLCQFASSFASAYGLRNQLEWPDGRVVRDILCATICCCALGGAFEDHVGRFESLRSVARVVLVQLGAEIRQGPPALFFTAVPVCVDPKQELSGEVEHETRFRSSWKAFRYSIEDNKEIVSRDLKDRRKLVIKLPLEGVTARQKMGNTKKPFCLVLQRADGAEFGFKVQKDNALKKCARTSYVLAFRTDADLMLWMSAVNQKSLFDELQQLK
jgi:hypothetical protein